MSVNQKQKVNPEEISILSTQLVKCSIDCPFGFRIENVEGFEFDTDFEMSFNLDDLMAKTEFRLDITSQSKESVEQEANGKFHFVFIFKVGNLKDLAVPDEKDKIVLDQGLANALASVSYSTTRGILFSRLNGTALENFVLPIIDPNSLLKIKT